ncbi:unknown [Firmicutes bacterium CAG:884]|nr:unknown [Firmicutes bacterium CAG:884]
MQIINLSNNDLESITSRSDYKKGSFGTVVQVEGDLGIKFYNDFLNSYKKKSINDIRMETIISVPQIELLTRKQEKVKLTTLPLGVAYYQNIPVGVIIKYFEKHNTLFELFKEHNTVIINILQRVLDIVNELLKNGIFQTDIKENNFLYSTIDYSAQAIDLDGLRVEIGRENIWLEETVYESLIDMFIFLVKEKLLFEYNNCELDENDYKARIECLKLLKHNIYVFESLQGFINEVKKIRLLEPPKKILKI